jgi:hypothetical protein
VCGSVSKVQLGIESVKLVHPILWLRLHPLLCIIDRTRRKSLGIDNPDVTVLDKILRRNENAPKDTDNSLVTYAAANC